MDAWAAAAGGGIVAPVIIGLDQELVLWSQPTV